MLMIIDAFVALIVLGVALSFVPGWFWRLTWVFILMFSLVRYPGDWAERYIKQEVKKLPEWLQEELK